MPLKVKAKSLANRLSGVSVSLTGIGISWKPKEAERDIVRGLIIYLEDRRALTMHHRREFSPHVVESILDIRKQLTEALQRLDDDSKANDRLRLMRGACAAFLNKMGPGHQSQIEFFEELGAFRAVFGQQIAELAYMYSIDVDQHLAAILPPEKE